MGHYPKIIILFFCTLFSISSTCSDGGTEAYLSKLQQPIALPLEADIPSHDLLAYAKKYAMPHWFFANPHIQAYGASDELIQEPLSYEIHHPAAEPYDWDLTEEKLAISHESLELPELDIPDSIPSANGEDYFLIIFLNDGKEKNKKNESDDKNEEEKEENTTSEKQSLDGETGNSLDDQPLCVDSLNDTEFLKRSTAQKFLKEIIKFAQQCKMSADKNLSDSSQQTSSHGITVSFIGCSTNSLTYYLLATDSTQQKKFLKLYAPYNPFYQLSHLELNSPDCYFRYITGTELPLALEARALKLLSHPNIVSGHIQLDLQKESHLSYQTVGAAQSVIVIQEYAGQSMKEYLQTRHGRELCCQSFPEILTSILKALIYIKEEGYFYSDLKAENIAIQYSEGSTVTTLIDLASIYTYKECSSRPDQCQSTPNMEAPEAKHLEQDGDGNIVVVPHYDHKSLIYTLAIIMAQITHDESVITELTCGEANNFDGKCALSERLQSLMRDHYAEPVLGATTKVLDQITTHKHEIIDTADSLKEALSQLYSTCTNSMEYMSASLDMLSVLASRPSVEDRPDFHQLMALIELIQSVQINTRDEEQTTGIADHVLMLFQFLGGIGILQTAAIAFLSSYFPD